MSTSDSPKTPAEVMRELMDYYAEDEATPSLFKPTTRQKLNEKGIFSRYGEKAAEFIKKHGSKKIQTADMKAKTRFRKLVDDELNRMWSEYHNWLNVKGLDKSKSSLIQYLRKQEGFTPRELKKIGIQESRNLNEAPITLKGLMHDAAIARVKKTFLNQEKEKKQASKNDEPIVRTKKSETTPQVRSAASKQGNTSPDQPTNQYSGSVNIDEIEKEAMSKSGLTEKQLNSFYNQIKGAPVDRVEAAVLNNGTFTKYVLDLGLIALAKSKRNT